MAISQVVVLQVDPETVKERLATRLIDRQEDKVYSEKERQLMPKDKAIKKRLTRRRHDYFTHILVSCSNTRQIICIRFSGKCGEQLLSFPIYQTYVCFFSTSLVVRNGQKSLRGKPCLLLSCTHSIWFNSLMHPNLLTSSLKK